MTKEFDVNQGHGDHIDCLCEPGTRKEFLATWLPTSVSNGEHLGATDNPVACDFGEDMPNEMPILLLGDKKLPLRLELLLAVNEKGKEDTVESAYPEYDGAEVKVKLTAIHEWAAGVEATLEGEVLGEAEREIAFFDTRYALNKGRYEIGKTYVFRLAAFAYTAEVLPEKDRELRFEGEEAVERRKRLGQEPEYDESGKPKPVIIRMDRMVGYLPEWGPYPDDAEFQSPVFGEVSSFPAFSSEFYKFDISIARGDDGEDVVVPMIARKSMFQEAPKTNDPVRGVLWLQGYCPNVECRDRGRNCVEAAK